MLGLKASHLDQGGSSKGIIKNQLIRSAKNSHFANFWRRVGAEFLGKIVNFSEVARSESADFVSDQIRLSQTLGHFLAKNDP